MPRLPKPRRTYVPVTEQTLVDMGLEARMDGITNFTPGNRQFWTLWVDEAAIGRLQRWAIYGVLDKQRQLAHDGLEPLAEQAARLALWGVLNVEGIAGGTVVAVEDASCPQISILTVAQARSDGLDCVPDYNPDKPALETAVWIKVSVNKTNFKGDKGDKGEPGADSTVPGPKGDTGTPGTDGTDGTDGTNGTDGAKGDKGEPGDSINDWSINVSVGKQPTGNSSGTDDYTPTGGTLAVCYQKPKTLITAGGQAVWPLTLGNPVVGQFVDIDMFDIRPILDRIIKSTFPGVHLRYFIKGTFVLSSVELNNISFALSPIDLSLLKFLSRPPRFYEGKTRASAHLDFPVAGTSHATGTAAGSDYDVTFTDENFVELTVGSDAHPIGCNPPLYFDYKFVQMPETVLTALALADRSQMNLFLRCLKVYVPNACEIYGSAYMSWAGITPSDPTENVCWGPFHYEQSSANNLYYPSLNGFNACFFYNTSIFTPPIYAERHATKGTFPKAVAWHFKGRVWACGGGYEPTFHVTILADTDTAPGGGISCGTFFVNQWPLNFSGDQQQADGVIDLDFSNAWWDTHEVNECTRWQLAFTGPNGNFLMYEMGASWEY